MGQSTRSHACFGLLAVAAGAGAACGYPATPVVLELELTSAETGEALALALDGVADPSASAFAQGLAISTRWATNRLGVHTVELCIDLDRGQLPGSIEASDAPVPLVAPHFTVLLTERDAEWGVAAQLETVPGVVDFTAYASRHLAVVEYDSSRTDAAQIRKAIEGPSHDARSGKYLFGRFKVRRMEAPRAGEAPPR